MTAPITVQGLTESEVLARRERGQGNNVELKTGRSYAQIFRQNTFTFINNILFFIGAVLVSLGRFTDAVVSVGLIVVNISIGVYQESRAKRQLDQIALLTRPQITVIRDGAEKTVDPSELVVGDLIVLRAGDQIVVDGTLVGEGKIDVDESLLTGESDLVGKRAGDAVMSGSFVVNGSAQFEAQKVGAESYAYKIATSARTFKIQKTPLQKDVDFFVRLLMAMAAFIGFLLFVSAILYQVPLVRSVQMAAVTAGIIPNGLFLMIIVAYALGILRIVGRGALVQQTNSVESLSNVNILCMDKTGTLTANKIHYASVEPLNGDKESLLAILGAFAHSATANNKTGEAVAAALSGAALSLREEVPFSSALKWSAMIFQGESADHPHLKGAYFLGAWEMLRPAMIHLGEEALKATEAKIAAYSGEGLRVVTFAHAPEAITLLDQKGLPALPPRLTPLGIVTFTDELRPHLQETLKGFAAAGVRLKIISGDNPETVAALAKQAGLPGDLKAISGTDLAAMDDVAFDTAAEENTVFGRITPQQKERLVGSLLSRKHYVAMIGDGVNDVLSLKKANLGIAMQSGSAATRGVADIVLLNDSFQALPPALLEGQRIVSGMYDVLRLFLSRAGFVSLLILACAVVGAGFPYIPTHVSLLTLLTVGIPTFFLAAWARPEVPKIRLTKAVALFVIPSAVTVSLFGLIVYLVFYLGVYQGQLNFDLRPTDTATFQRYVSAAPQLSANEEVPLEKAGFVARTALTTFTILTGLLLLIFVEPPIPFFVGGDTLSPDKRPTILAAIMALSYGVIATLEPTRRFFELIVLPPAHYLLIGGIVLIWVIIQRWVWRWHIFERFFGLPIENMGEEGGRRM
ncbi:MAG TPA: HAD-IC family P-type ATPase [Aggregatilineales bacterium]|nr:HAD-IC family P-type ATPase [Anaerolineales bacterium]HRE46194.1 HAD-IC family P-type ATPase [Aggregatilineales bacterium]